MTDEQKPDLSEADGLPSLWNKSKAELIKELVETRQKTSELHRRVIELEAAEAEWRRTEAGLRKSEPVLQSLINSLPQNIYSKDLNGRFTFANQQFCRTEAKSLADILGKTDFDLYPPEFARKYQDDDRRVIETEQIYEIEEEHKPIDGASFYVQVIKSPVYDSKGQTVGTLGIFWDITERKQTAERFRLAAEIASDIIYEWDVATDHLEWFGDIDRVLGYEPGQFSRTVEAWAKAIHPDDQPKLANSVERHRESAEPIYEEYRIQRKDGRWLYWIDRAVPLLNSQGRPYKWIGVCIDVTERVRAEKELRQYRNHLEELVKQRTAELENINDQLEREIAERMRIEQRLTSINECFLNFEADPLENINHLTALCGEVLGATCALYNRLDQRMLCSWGQWNTPPGYNPIDEPEGHICFDVIQRGKDEVFVIRNLLQTSYAQTDPNVIPYELQTYVGWPVKFDDSYVGSLCTVYQNDFVPTEADTRFMGIIASAIGVEEKRKQDEEALRQYTTQLEALREVGLELTAELDLDALLHSVGERAVELLGGTDGGLYLYRPDRDLLEWTVSVGATVVPVCTVLERGEGVAGKVWETGQPLIVDNYRHWSGRPVMHDGISIASVVDVPIQWGQEFLGVLNVSAQTPGRFTPTDAELLSLLATQAAIAIRNARLYEQTRRDAVVKAELLKEVNHRVANNLTAIIGLLRTESRYAPTREEATIESTLDRLSQRINGLAEAHSLLSQSEWSPIRLSYLATRIIHAALNTLPSDQQVQVEISSATVEVSPRQASNLALVINELATNTLKHTLAGRYPVCITIQIAVEDDGTIFCQYRDDGPGYPDEVLRMEQYGVGIYLINRIVTMTLQGQLTLANEGGAVTTMRFATEERNST